MRVTVKALEAYLQDTGTPYVAVDEAKRALFAGVSLKSFDFVIYMADSENLLVTCKPFTCGECHEIRDNMVRWQEVFGQGFRAAEARMKAGEIVFVDLDGKEIRLPKPLAAAPVVGVEIDCNCGLRMSDGSEIPHKDCPACGGTGKRRVAEADNHVADTGKMVAGQQGLLFSPVEVYLTGG